MPTFCLSRGWGSVLARGEHVLSWAFFLCRAPAAEESKPGSWSSTWRLEGNGLSLYFSRSCGTLGRATSRTC